ncbi:hypothetical protein BJ165DRAFT_1598839 [Panaeolus papilionaceus]|nr:hypothetical protein BJ165DRAFT_1598839 [Panaeolus papilionaceus]
MSTAFIDSSTLKVKSASRAETKVESLSVHTEYARKDHVFQSSAHHLSNFHQSSHELAMAFSQVPWMRFNIVAQPDLVQLASNEALQGFVNQVTSITIAAVSKEIHEEVTKAVSQVSNNISGTVNEQMKTAHANLMKEIVSVSAKTTATEHEYLGIPPMNRLIKDLNIEHVCPPVPAPPKPSRVVPPKLDTAFWIWTPEKIAGLGLTRAFRRTISTASPVNALIIDIAADDMYTLYVNGKVVGCGKEWKQPDRYTIVFEETCQVAVTAVVSQGATLKDVGLIAAGKLWNTNEHITPTVTKFVTNAKWRTLAAYGASKAYIDPDFDDDRWPRAHERCAYGGQPWGVLKTTLPGKAAGQRIANIKGIPNAPLAPPAEEWKD